MFAKGDTIYRAASPNFTEFIVGHLAKTFAKLLDAEILDLDAGFTI